MKLIAISSVVAGCLLLASCAKPIVVSKLTPSEQQTLTCEQIASELKAAQEFQEVARAEDRFKFRYILIAPAVVSMYNMNKAESAAKDRSAELQILASQKGCK